MSKDIAQLIRRLERLRGWTVELKKGGHYAAKGPELVLYFFSATPSDYRSIRNIRAELRKRGADV